ncbi:MAG: hypothetical protein V3V86_12305, partial [Gammaproteobacteria bacterium]
MCLEYIEIEMTIVPRRVTRVGTPSGELPGVQPLTQFLDVPAFVVLGDPGAGKTTSFRQAAEEEANAEFVTIRDFCSLSPGRWTGKTLYLDALDEHRAKFANGEIALDEIRRRLDQLGCPRFRLSCRAADWFGSSDMQALAAVSPDSAIAVLRLEPLSDGDIRTIAADHPSAPDAFVEEAERRGVRELLGNPQTLDLFLRVVAEGGWPTTRTELYEQATNLLAQETNESHARASSGAANSREILQAAGHLCAILLCSGAAGFALTDVNADADFPALDRLGGDAQLLRLTAGRRLFIADGPERVLPAHRTIAEYLAALYLVACIRDALPVRRVLALIAGNDGVPPTDLRGLYAWLACLSRDSSLIEADPFGIVLYGDPGPLSVPEKTQILRCVARLADANPWFRTESWASEPFGTLSSPEMEAVFAEILADCRQQPAFVSCVLDAIRHGTTLSGLGDLLLTIVRDGRRNEFVRTDALLAFLSVCADRTDDLLALLDDIHAGAVADEDQQLRGMLLRTLYPDIVGVGRICQYLVGEHPRNVRAYYYFVTHGLIDATPTAEVPTLLDEIAQAGLPNFRQDSYALPYLVGKLLVRGLSEHGAVVEAERLYEWLSIGEDEHESLRLRKEQAEPIRAWFEANPEVIRWLFARMVDTSSPDSLRYETHRFWERLHHPEPPRGLAHWLLDLACGQADEPIADSLFREAVAYRISRGKPDAPTLEELFAFVEDNPGFRDALEAELWCPISERRLKRAIERQERDAEEAANLAEIVDKLARQIDAIRADSAIAALVHLAKIYFGIFVEVDQELSRVNRLFAMTTPEITAATLDGFIAALHRPDTTTAKQVGRLAVKNTHYPWGWVILAGMDIIVSRSEAELLAIPEGKLQSALAFNYTIGVGDEPPWLTRLVGARPDVAAQGLLEFWRPQLRRRVGHVQGLYSLAYSDFMVPVAQRSAVALLRNVPGCQLEILTMLLTAAIQHADSGELLGLTREVLDQGRRIKSAQRLYWFATAFLLAPDEFGLKLSRSIAGSESRALQVLGFTAPDYPRNPTSDFVASLPPRSLALLIRMLGRAVSFGVDEDGYLKEPIQRIIAMVDRLARDPSAAATSALAQLRDDEGLAPYRNRVVHASSTQARIRRDSEYRPPALAEVTKTLTGGPPANARDLQALVFDKLRDMAADIERGVADAYKAFWNVDAHGRTTKPRPENDCR